MTAQLHLLWVEVQFQSPRIPTLLRLSLSVYVSLCLSPSLCISFFTLGRHHLTWFLRENYLQMALLSPALPPELAASNKNGFKLALVCRRVVRNVYIVFYYNNLVRWDFLGFILNGVYLSVCRCVSISIYFYLFIYLLFSAVQIRCPTCCGLGWVYWYAAVVPGAGGLQTATGPWPASS